MISAVVNSGYVDRNRWSRYGRSAVQTQTQNTHKMLQWLREWSGRTQNVKTHHGTGAKVNWFGEHSTDIWNHLADPLHFGLDVVLPLSETNKHMCSLVYASLKNARSRLHAVPAVWPSMLDTMHEVAIHDFLRAEIGSNPNTIVAGSWALNKLLRKLDSEHRQPMRHSGWCPGDVDIFSNGDAATRQIIRKAISYWKDRGALTCVLHHKTKSMMRGTLGSGIPSYVNNPIDWAKPGPAAHLCQAVNNLLRLVADDYLETTAGCLSLLDREDHNDTVLCFLTETHFSEEARLRMQTQIRALLMRGGPYPVAGEGSSALPIFPALPRQWKFALDSTKDDDDSDIKDLGLYTLVVATGCTHVLDVDAVEMEVSQDNLLRSIGEVHDGPDAGCFYDPINLDINLYHKMYDAFSAIVRDKPTTRKIETLIQRASTITVFNFISMEHKDPTKSIESVVDDFDLNVCAVNCRADVNGYNFGGIGDAYIRESFAERKKPPKLLLMPAALSTPSSEQPDTDELDDDDIVGIAEQAAKAEVVRLLKYLVRGFDI